MIADARVGELVDSGDSAESFVGADRARGRVLGDGGGGLVLVELQEVVRRGDQAPFRPNGGSSASSERFIRQAMKICPIPAWS